MSSYLCSTTLVKLFAQHGFSDGLKTVEGLRKELIDGVIFSPRDITPEKLRESASKFTESAPIFERLFDRAGTDLSVA